MRAAHHAATPLVALLAASCVTPLAHASSDDPFWEALLDPTRNPDLHRVWAQGAWGVPPVFLLQLAALLVLLWRVALRRRPEQLGAGHLERLLLQLGVAIAPVFMLVMSACAFGGYQTERGLVGLGLERGLWFFHQHSGLAGLVLVPFYASASWVVGMGIARREYRLRSGTNWILSWTLLAICLWYAFATAVLHMGDDRSWDLSWTAVVPAVAAANCALLIADIRRQGRVERAPTRVVVAWLSGLMVSLALRVPLAMRIFEALPADRPSGYGDCFVVGAAARGHPAFVGSRFDPALGRFVNRQWHTLKSVEKALAERRPALHRGLRRLYDRIGPRVAGRIRSPLAADIVYLLLKPAEWLGRLYLDAEG